jgi:hypothetical protein
MSNRTTFGCNEQSRQNISGYITRNPAKWNDDKFHTDQRRKNKYAQTKC